MFVDLTLPDGNGLAIVEQLRKLGCSPKVVVALTGHDEPSIAKRCTEAGCTEVLLKPVPTRDLLRRTDTWLGDRATPA